MKKFNLLEFPKFLDSLREQPFGITGDEYMRILGYTSAQFNPLDGLAWSLSDEEYTWFVLRWS